jgi:hypothetical protein
MKFCVDCLVFELDGQGFEGARQWVDKSAHIATLSTISKWRLFYAFGSEILKET